MVLPDLGQLLIIVLVIFLIFGAAKLPALGESLGTRLSRRARRDDGKGGKTPDDGHRARAVRTLPDP